MLRGRVWLVCASLSACGGLDPRASDSGATPARPPDVLVGPTDDDPPWNLEPPTDWRAGGEVWSFDLRDHHHPGLPDSLWSSLPRALALEWVAEDPPWVAHRTAAIVAGSEPVLQDLCVATVLVTHGTSDGVGGFSLRLGPTELDLGQPWSWDTFAIAGTRSELGTVDDLAATGSIPAFELAEAVFGTTTEPCLALGALGLACVPCADSPGDCVTIDLNLTARRETLIVEPIAPPDVALNPGCEPE